MRQPHENYFILTGGPGSGKSTVERELKAMGVTTVEEAARGIIQREVENGGDATPWGDTRTYSRLMLEHALHDFDSHKTERGTVMFDRGIPDVLGYMRLIGLTGLAGLEEACRERRYNKRVFFFPPWKEIYETDKERKQDWETAERTYQVMLATYKELDYQPEIVPCLPPKERAQWIVRRLAQK